MHLARVVTGHFERLSPTAMLSMMKKLTDLKAWSLRHSAQCKVRLSYFSEHAE